MSKAQFILMGVLVLVGSIVGGALVTAVIDTDEVHAASSVGTDYPLQALSRKATRQGFR